MKRRLGVFVFYDSLGCVERHVVTLLDSLSEYMSELLVVVNGYADEKSMHILKNYTDKVLVRENIGYDGGAYKDVFLSYLKRDYLEQWDEIIMFNDTFYAPIFPWAPVFDKMDKTDVDFWGLTEYLGHSNCFNMGIRIGHHIQGYFLVCRKSVIASDVFYEFWEQLSYPKTYYDAVADYEAGFSSYMSNAGFDFVSYVRACGRDDLLEYGKNIYMEKSLELLEELCLPIVKRKVFCLENYNNSKNLLDWIKEKTNYDTGEIIEYIDRIEKEGKNSFNIHKLNEFCKEYENIYIYGHGNVGTNIAGYLLDKGINYKGFIVTSKNGSEKENVYEYREIRIKESDGIILGLGKKAFDEVYSSIIKEVDKRQLFIPIQ